MRIFAKVNTQNDYHNINIANAAYGFAKMGFEIVKYEKVNDILEYVTRQDLVLDYIKQVESIFYKFGIPEVKIPDYPIELKSYLGRNIWVDKMNRINNHPELWNIFVKPIKEKAFTGKVIREPRDLIGCGNSTENYDVLCSDIVEFKREWRCYVKYDKILDIKPYTGDYHYQYNADIIDLAMRDFTNWQDRPMGCSLDFGVTRDNRTLLVEVNDGYSLASYGLVDIDYAKLISARWAQLLNRVDECLF